MSIQIPICRVFQFALLVLLFLPSKGQEFQNSKQTSNKIKQLQKSIDQTNLLLSGSKEHKNQILKQLEVLQSQIFYRKELHKSISQEITAIDSQIVFLKKQHIQNSKDLKERQNEYIFLIKKKLLHRITHNPLLSLLNPVEIDTKVKKWYLIDRLEQKSRSSFINLQEIKTTYHTTLKQLESESFSRDSFLHATIQEEKNLTEDLTKMNQLINELSSKESILNKDLIAYKKQKDELKHFIESSIKNLTYSKESIRLIKSRLNLRYPMQNSTIVSRFGNNMDKGNSKLIIRNNGIDLQSVNPFVKVSIPSEVVEIRKMPNQLYLLITRSENLFVVYSNLETVLLKNGEKVDQGINLGKAKKTDDGIYELHFETWIEKNPVDPLVFLKK
jgi:septal ring factor EnvC (AmiA/AmiB activator)